MAVSGAGGRWSDFSARFASAAILGPVAIFCVWSGGAAWICFILTALVGLAFEWAALVEAKAEWRGVSLALALLLGLSFALKDNFAWGFLVLLVFSLGVAWRFGAWPAFGIPYAGIGGLALLWLRLHAEHGLPNTLFLIATVWGTDIGAYLAGRIFGGAKMAPRISPGKTWSGAVGGLAAGGLAGAVLAGGGNMDFSALPVAFLLSFFAQAGDLLESGIKRRLGVKDSGRTIPGHGGLFDRLDGFLAAAPVAAICALCVHGGLPLWG